MTLRGRVFGWVGACALLAGCADLTGFGAPQTAALPLLAGDVIAAVPEGYCIDTGASRPRDGFAVMAACSVLAGEGDLPALNGVVTVQVAEAQAPLGDDAAALAALLKEDAGRTLLSQTGDGSTISVRGTTVRNGVVTVRFVDQAPPPIAGLQQTEWRGFFDLNGHLATVAVRGRDAAPLGTDDGEILLQSVIRAMQQINAGREIVIET